jgi:hypothetical protein
MGACGRVVGWGTVLQAGRSQVWVLMSWICTFCMISWVLYYVWFQLSCIWNHLTFRHICTDLWDYMRFPLGSRKTVFFFCTLLVSCTCLSVSLMIKIRTWLLQILYLYEQHVVGDCPILLPAMNNTLFMVPTFPRCEICMKVLHVSFKCSTLFHNIL